MVSALDSFHRLPEIATCFSCGETVDDVFIVKKNEDGLREIWCVDCYINGGKEKNENKW